MLKFLSLFFKSGQNAVFLSPLINFHRFFLYITRSNPFSFNNKFFSFSCFNKLSRYNKRFKSNFNNFPFIKRGEKSWKGASERQIFNKRKCTAIQREESGEIFSEGETEIRIVYNPSKSFPSLQWFFHIKSENIFIRKLESNLKGGKSFNA